MFLPLGFKDFEKLLIHAKNNSLYNKEVVT